MMKTQGTTWNAVVTDDFDKTVFPQANGGILEVYAEGNIPSYGFNDGVVLGFRVDDIESASAELAASGVELLGGVNRLDTGYAYRHFRGPDGKVYGLNEDPQGPHPAA